MIRGFSARASLAAALFVTSALSAMSASATSASAETLRAFDVPAQPLAAALNSFARQAGVQIFFPSELIAGRRSPTLKGRMAPRAALDVLLAGSGLTVASDDGHTVMLKVGGNDLTPAATSATASTSSAVERAVDTVLAGQVSQAGDGAHLNGVIVRIGTSGQTGGQTGVTDEQGRYRFANIKPGTYQVSFDYIGYPTMVQTVVLTSEVTTRDVVLGDEAGTILVVGQRAAQAKALSEQRAADNVRNVVSADQAGRFPDFNAAESLRRVPGVSVQREVDAGEGRYISIRGLDSGLNNTQINGMNAAQPEKESRKVPLDMVQTSALSSITVHKTLLPDQDADGIGGAVVLETATAFDYKKRVIDLTVSGFYHDLANKFSPMVQGTLATKFGASDQFGILVSGGYSKRKTRGYVLYQDEDYLRLDENDASKGVTPLEFHTARYDNDRETISGNVAFNWAVSDATQLVFKGSYNRLYDKELSRAIYYEGGTEDYDDAGRLILTEPGSVNIFDEYEETKLTQQSYVLNGTTNTGAFKLDYGVGYS
ncbi:MAG: hypothetical protein EOP66_08595, partial [Sphingomonas sp.]